MKSIAITCIICGAFVFVAPMLYQFGSFALCAYALANTRLSSLNLTAPELGDNYRIASVVFGLLLTAIGVGLALRKQVDANVSLAQPARA